MSLVSLRQLLDHAADHQYRAKDICLPRFEASGSAGQAAKIAVVPRAQMAGRYRKDEPGAPF